MPSDKVAMLVKMRKINVVSVVRGCDCVKS